MPCTSRKARILLKGGKAKIIQYKPFIIQLTVPTGESIQKVSVGVDEGARHIGLAATSQGVVLLKGEVELRQDVHSLLLTRAQYRRSRRARKTRHRKPRFLNRRKSEEWSPPSIQAKLDVNFLWIDRFCQLFPNPELYIEVGKFDVAKMINPEIQGVDYQHGQTYGYYDVRYFVFARDGYTCQVCRKKGGILHTHHIVYRSEGGTDRADNLITVCSDCHTSAAHKPGGILYRWMKERKKVKQYKEPPFMNILRHRTFTKYPAATITYGSETSPRRKELGLPKTHYNDAVVISGLLEIKESPGDWFCIKQMRKKKRSLHEAVPRKGRKEPNRAQKRNSKNTKCVKSWALNDEICYLGKQGWISGFTGTSAYVQDADGNYMQIPGKSYKPITLSRLSFVSKNNNWIYTKKEESGHSSPH